MKSVNVTFADSLANLAVHSKIRTSGQSHLAKAALNDPAA